MSKSLRFIGLDVHKDSIVIAVAEAGRDPAEVCGEIPYVPDEEAEAIRDLERAREDAKNAERAARQQLGKFFLRHDRRWPKSNWTREHLAWIGQQKFEHQAQQRVLTDYLKAVEDAAAREKQLTEELAEVVKHSSLYPLIKALQAFRGIQLLTAVTIAAELVDLKRFSSPRQLMAFLGLVPSEHSSGQSQRRGRITRAGNGHVRRVLTEAAWSYRYQPRMSKAIRKRNEGVSVGVQRLAWKAQQRLHQRTLFSWHSCRRPRLIMAVNSKLGGNGLKGR
jgi:transposase